MIKKGEEIEINTGPFKGFKGIVKKIGSYQLTIDVDMFGIKTEVKLPCSDFGLIYKPEYKSFLSLITEFDNNYKKKAPLRYAQLEDGITRDQIYSSPELKNISNIPEDFINLYQWKNGLKNKGGWKNEFKEDSWYELIPLDNRNHFMSLKTIEGCINMWNGILKEARNNKEACYWKEGFIPFLMVQNYGLLVIDTVGYFEGQPGQIIQFDYKCANGYEIVYENLNKWLETKISLLQQDLLFSEQEIETDSIEKEINEYYTSKFRHELLVT